MTAKPERGSFRIRRDLRRFGLGMLQISARTRDRRKFEQREAIVTKLIDDAQVDVLRMLKEDRVKIHQLVQLDRTNKLTGANAMANIVLDAPLFETWDAMLTTMAPRAENRKRYGVTRNQLARIWEDRPAMRVGDLQYVDWTTMSREWPNSASDWNHVRRGVSRLLSVALGDKYHPTRRAIVGMIPLRPENERVPDVTPAVFFRVLRHLREDLQPVFVTLAATGLRVRSEFLLLTETNLMPATRQIRIPGDEATKERYVAVAPEMWGYIRAAIPSPIRYKWLRVHWRRACEAADVDGLTIHDLRHCHAQWATNAGAQLSEVQVQLGHTTPLMSSRYARQKVARAVAGKVGRALKRASR